MACILYVPSAEPPTCQRLLPTSSWFKECSSASLLSKICKDSALAKSNLWTSERCAFLLRQTKTLERRQFCIFLTVSSLSGLVYTGLSIQCGGKFSFSLCLLIVLFLKHGEMWLNVSSCFLFTWKLYKSKSYWTVKRSMHNWCELYQGQYTAFIFYDPDSTCTGKD